MKKIFILFAIAIFFASCSTARYTEYGYSLDYSSYTKSGFFITEANSVSFGYTPIGSVIGVSITGSDIDKDVKKEPYTKTLPDGSKIYNTNFGKYKKDNNSFAYQSSMIKYASYDASLQQLVKEAKKIGANAIIGLHFVTSSTNGDVYEVRAYGMAIKK